MTLDEIYKLEEHIEDGVLLILKDIGAPVEKSRETTIQDTPIVLIKSIIGAPAGNHQKILANPADQFYDTYATELTTKVVTNRTTNATAPAHTVLLGQLRKRLQRPMLMRNWTNAVVSILDSREQGTVDTEEEAGPNNNLDTTTVSWYLLIQIKADAWPLEP